MYYYTEEDDKVFRAEASARKRKTEEEAEIKRLKAEIETLERKLYDEGEAILALNHQLLTVRAETIIEFANAVKLEFYKEFDELISSIMADKINKLVNERIGGDGECQ